MSDMKSNIFIILNKLNGKLFYVLNCIQFLLREEAW